LSRNYCSSNGANYSTTVKLTVYSLNLREEGIGDTHVEVSRDGLRVAFARFRYAHFACSKTTACFMDTSGVGVFCFVTFIGSVAMLMSGMSHVGIREGI
jgi:hypothetical protein